jgi:hypothetical protein
MFINHKHKFIFIHIPKNAGTSIRNSFRLEGYDKRVVKKPYPHDPCSKIREYCGEEVWNTFFKFAIVRNPYDRMVSYYHFHKSTQYRFPAKANSLSFDEWIIKGLDSNMKKNQTWYLDEEVDYIGRVEYLEKDWDLICQEIGIEPYTLPNYNVSEHKEWKSYYTDDSDKVVRKIFQDDFETFNYDYI